MTDTSFIENEERQALRKSVSAWASNYGSEYYLKKARAHEHTDELWQEAGKLGFLGVNLPEQPIPLVWIAGGRLPSQIRSA